MPNVIITRLRTAAAAQAPEYGFAGDPNSPITAGGRTLYYGHLLYVGGY
jgi:subtilisin